MQHRPLLVWSLAFAGGIGVAGKVPLVLFVALAGLGLALLACGGRRWALATAGIALTGLGAGAMRLTAFQTVPASDISHWADGAAPVTVTGTVVGDPEERRGGRIRLLVRAERLETRGQTLAVTGNVSVDLLGPALAVGTAAPDYGDQVALDGHLETPPDATNPGAFSWREFLARRAVYSQLQVKRPHAAQILGAGRLNPYLSLAWAMRRRVLEAVKASLPPTQAAVLSGILLGKRTELPPDLMADFVHTGTVHVLASAGLHVGIVAFWLLTLCERLTLPRKASALFLIAALWLYALMAGGRPSVTRAVVMATIYFGALLFEREPDLPTTLGAAALLILAWQPTALFEPGFQLSFLTVFTLALAMPLWEGFWRPWVQKRVTGRIAQKAALWGLEMAGLSLLAQIGSLPVVASSYNELSWSGWFANMLVVPLLFLLIPLGFSGALVWSLWHAAGAGLLGLAGAGLALLTRLVRFFGESDWAYRAVVSPPPMLILGYYGLLACLASLANRQKGKAAPGGV